MGRSWKLGRVFGIPVYVHPTFLLLIPMFALGTVQGDRRVAIPFSLLLLLAVFACVFLHELGHALAARVFGIRTRDITLTFIGGMARLERMNERPIEELWIALAGPAVNLLLVMLLTPLLLGLALAGGASGPPTVRLELSAGWLALSTRFVFYVWMANLVLAVFNLIPALPLDGGRVLRAVIAHFRGQLRATEIAASVSLVMAGLIAACAFLPPGFNPVALVISAFVVFAGRVELHGMRQREEARRLAALMPPELPEEPVLPQLRPHRPGFTGVTWNAERGVWVRWDGGRAVAVYAERID